MATSQGQDVIRCELCENPVEFHCNPCITNMCGNCVLKHMSDKTKKHEVVEFKNRKENLVYPECKSHESKCETYCRGCKVPVCIKCVISRHKEHDVTEIEEIVQRRRYLIESDTQKLRENIQIREERRKEATDKVFADIAQREKEIQEMVHDVAEKMRKEISGKQNENTDEKSKVPMVPYIEWEIQRIIAKNRKRLQSRNAMDFVNYSDANDDLIEDLELARNLCPIIICSEVQEDQITRLFGTLSFREDNNVRQILHLKNTPEVLATVQSPYSDLWRMVCAGKYRIWTSGRRTDIMQIDRDGNTLLSIKTNWYPLVLSIDNQQRLVFSTSRETKVYMCKEGTIETYLDTTNWRPRGICQTRNGDMLVSLRSKDVKQSKVVRYSGSTETQSIQYDGQGQPLFSTGSLVVLLLTENGNGNICVADYGGKEVVVVNASGELRFKYRGNLSKQSKYTDFEPSKIATDVNHCILINDYKNDIVHIIDSGGNFICYIEYPCRGGLSIDADHNLIIGDEKSGKIKIIKYLE